MAADPRITPEFVALMHELDSASLPNAATTVAARRDLAALSVIIDYASTKDPGSWCNLIDTQTGSVLAWSVAACLKPSGRAGAGATPLSAAETALLDLVIVRSESLGGARAAVLTDLVHSFCRLSDRAAAVRRLFQVGATIGYDGNQSGFALLAATADEAFCGTDRLHVGTEIAQRILAARGSDRGLNHQLNANPAWLVPFIMVEGLPDALRFLHATEALHEPEIADELRLMVLGQYLECCLSGPLAWDPEAIEYMIGRRPDYCAQEGGPVRTPEEQERAAAGLRRLMLDAKSLKEGTPHVVARGALRTGCIPVLEAIAPALVSRSYSHDALYQLVTPIAWQKFVLDEAAYTRTIGFLRDSGLLDRSLQKCKDGEFCALKLLVAHVPLPGLWITRLLDLGFDPQQRVATSGCLPEDYITSSTLKTEYLNLVRSWQAGRAARQVLGELPSPAPRPSLP